MPRKRKKKRPSPKTTAYIPPTEECPDVTDRCIEEVVEEILIEKIGHLKLEHTTIISPVILELIDSGGSVLERWEWSEDKFTKEWPCLSEFVDDVRHRLSELVDIELSAFESDINLEVITLQVRDTLFDIWGVKDISELRGPIDPESVANTWIRDTLGLQARKRPRRLVAKWAGLRLHRWTDPTTKSIVRQARALRGLLEHWD